MCMIYTYITYMQSLSHNAVFLFSLTHKHEHTHTHTHSFVLYLITLFIFFYQQLMRDLCPFCRVFLFMSSLRGNPILRLPLRPNAPGCGKVHGATGSQLAPGHMEVWGFEEEEP